MQRLWSCDHRRRGSQDLRTAGSLEHCDAQQFNLRLELRAQDRRTTPTPRCKLSSASLICLVWRLVCSLVFEAEERPRGAPTSGRPCSPPSFHGAPENLQRREDTQIKNVLRWPFWRKLGVELITVADNPIGCCHISCNVGYATFGARINRSRSRFNCSNMCSRFLMVSVMWESR